MAFVKAGCCLNPLQTARHTCSAATGMLPSKSNRLVPQTRGGFQVFLSTGNDYTINRPKVITDEWPRVTPLHSTIGAPFSRLYWGGGSIEPALGKVDLALGLLTSCGVGFGQSNTPTFWLRVSTSHLALGPKGCNGNDGERDRPSWSQFKKVDSKPVTITRWIGCGRRSSEVSMKVGVDQTAITGITGYLGAKNFRWCPSI